MPRPVGIWNDDIGSVYSTLSGSPAGLSSADAKKRLNEYGHNTVPEKDRKQWQDLLLSQLNNPLLLILALASLVSVFAGDIFETAIIILIVAVTAILGFFQEYKAEKALSRLKGHLSYTAVVLRDGEKVQLPAMELVPGDIVDVGLGDIVPADIRIIETRSITVDESVLTGESREAEKTAVPPCHLTTALHELRNGLFMGTVVLGGHARGIVVATGRNTFFGKTAVVFSSKVPESDFQVEIRKFGAAVFKIIIAMTLFVFVVNYLLGHGDTNPLTDSALFALAIAIGMAPEALPAVITVTLANGSMRLAEKKVITKKLAAIEDLGNMDVLCSDKTGTLTEGQLQVEKYIDADGKVDETVLHYAFLCNAAVGSLHIRGNAVDAAIRRYALGRKTDVSAFRMIEDIPFDYTRRRMGQVVECNGVRQLIVKGAPESVLSVCTKARRGTATTRITKIEGAAFRKQISGHCNEGYSVLGVACREIAKKDTYSQEDECEMVFCGFVLLSNPPKQTVHATLKRLAGLGISLKILTGDDAVLTKKLCTAVGIAPAGNRVVSGAELSGMNKLKLSEAVEKYNVFARVTPEQKLLIVETLRENGHVVGFLGDGINDAPALRTADIGISVNTAADVAKGASHIILLKKSLTVICDGVEEGRKIFGNITKYLLNTMSSNQGNMATVSLSSLFLPFMPLLPSQILLNNLLTDLPLVTISTDNVDETYTKKPQRWDLGMITRFMLFFGVISTIFDLLLIFVLYFVLGVQVLLFRTAWFLMSVLSEMLIMFSLRTRHVFFRSAPSGILLRASVFAMLLSVAIIFYTPAAALFGFVPLAADTLILVAAVLTAYFAATELGKLVFFNKMNNEQAANNQKRLQTKK